MTSKLKELKEEIEHYCPPANIAKAMLKFGKLGLEFSGHGSGFGGEDFNLYKKYNSGQLYINLSTRKIKNNCSVSFMDNEWNIILNKNCNIKKLTKIVNLWLQLLNEINK